MTKVGLRPGANLLWSLTPSMRPSYRQRLARKNRPVFDTVRPAWSKKRQRKKLCSVGSEETSGSCAKSYAQNASSSVYTGLLRSPHSEPAQGQSTGGLSNLELLGKSMLVSKAAIVLYISKLTHFGT